MGEGVLPLTTLRNEYVEASFLIDKGADVYSLVDLRTGVDVLFKPPRGARQPGPWLRSENSMERWLEAYSGGWQVLLPNGGEECIQDGVTWGYHGEAALVPWSMVEHTPTRLILETRLFTVPVRLHREFELIGPVLKLQEVVTNESPMEIEMMWIHHPAFGAPFIEEGCVFSVGFRTVIADELAPGSVLAAGSKHSWPLATGGGKSLDLSKVPGPQEKRAILAYLVDMEEPFFAITNPRLRLGVGFRWSADVFDKAWLWQEVHSGEGWPWFGQAYVVAVEPATTIPAHGMSHAKKVGGGGVRLAPFASKELDIEATFFEGTGAIAGLEEGGRVLLN